MFCATCNSPRTPFRCPDCLRDFCGGHWVDHLEAVCPQKGKCHHRKRLGKMSVRCNDEQVEGSRFCRLHGTVKKRDGTRVPRK